ncbi:hypothetical protein A2J03_28080, partial [Rhodococcus sp. EPR-157]|uniref:hypothetical protein n=1 Tax=Rhodococcus sp. EPR-157 TaxID=1813677 RepID=UPI0007BC60F3
TTEHALVEAVPPESAGLSDATPVPEETLEQRLPGGVDQAETESGAATISDAGGGGVSNVVAPELPTPATEDEPSTSAATSAEGAVRPTAVYVPAAVKEAWKTRSQREKKSYGEIVEDAFAEHTPDTLVRLFAPKPVGNAHGGMPRRARPKVATGGVEVRPHLVVDQTEWIDQQVASSPLIPSRSALIAAVVEAYVIS